jgi:uncharacterized protein YqjF (DUF2071 family)
MNWHDLVFMHWPVPADTLRPLLPPRLELDTFDGNAWLGVVPFYMTDVRPRAFPKSFASAFPEINVRTYVRYRERFGVWFFSLDAASRLTVLGARRFYRLPYWLATMTYARHGSEIGFESRRQRDERVGIACRYRGIGAPFEATPGSLEYFLTERYCLFSADREGGLYCGEIHHRPWTLQPAEAEIRMNTMADPIGLSLGAHPLLHFSQRLDVVAWTLDRLRV